MDAIEALKTRRSVRAYKADPVPKEIIEDIVDCGRLAATARNVQPWEFVVVTDAALRARIADTTEYGKFIADAPVCIIVLCEEGTYFLEDGSAATQNIMVAARAHGLGTCWVAGDKKPYADTIRKMVGAPDGYKLISHVALGYAADIPNPAKRALDEVIHWESY
jgi:nitroreductase